MDNRIIGGGGTGSVSYPLPAPNPTPSAPANNIKLPQEVQVPLPSSVTEQPAIDFSNENARIELIKRISAKNFSYPLGDAKLTIYKDKNGTFIAKYTSLRDGSVKQIPEPQLLEDFAIGVGGPLVTTRA